MIKEYTISNFKAFSTPATLPIKPITLIYGANSAGKSSIFQSLLMLKQTLEEAGNDQQLLITKGNYVDVGGYRDFIHNHHEDSRFKFKAIFENDGWIMDTFDIMEYLVNTRDVSKHHEVLEEFMRSKDYGISIEIGYDEQQGNYINEIELFIENSEKAFLSYTRQGLTEDQINILHKLGILKESIVNINDDVNFVKYFLKILPAGVENSSDQYSFSFNDYVFLKNFFPVGINTRDYQKNQYDFFEDFGEHYSGNVSFVTLAGGNRLRNFLKNLHCIGPLRQHPSRIY